MKHEQGRPGSGNDRDEQKSSLQRVAPFLPEDGERSIILFSLFLRVFAPDTDCGKSVFFTVYDTRNGGGQRVQSEWRGWS
ncbi:hypothetical protein PBY51_020419 [Eleginops maclovinus]|uniref:Uncharacterized protein n=1 Tax=Eleginops maclovinus TaxID=56733 RepID=A0AAN7XRW1_ELEMC|nr:hypothetical protein PBY51_020419 [Eleginops maclovinus]